MDETDKTLEVALSKLEANKLKEISEYTREPTVIRRGYHKSWSPKTNHKLIDKGLVKEVNHSIVITDAGLDWLGRNG